MRSENLARAQSSGKIRIEDVGPFFLFHGERRPALNFPGTIDKDVDFAKAPERSGKQLFERRTITDIRANAQSLASTPFDLGCGFVNLFPAARRSDNIGSSVGEAEAQRASYARSSSDYYRGLAFEAEDIFRHRSLQFTAISPQSQSWIRNKKNIFSVDAVIPVLKLLWIVTIKHSF
jgi:hypothetical protein